MSLKDKLTEAVELNKKNHQRDFEVYKQLVVALRECEGRTVQVQEAMQAAKVFIKHGPTSKYGMVELTLLPNRLQLCHRLSLESDWACESVPSFEYGINRLSAILSRIIAELGAAAI